MELFEYLRHLYKFRYWLVAGLLLGAIAGGLFASLTKEKYQANISLYVQRKTDQASNEFFTYEGYYAQQTAVIHTDTVLKLLTTDEILSQAVQNANQEATKQSIQAARGSIIGKKESPQLIKVTVTQSSEDEAFALANGISQAVKQRTTDLNQYGDQSLSVEQVEQNPMVLTVKPSKILYTAVAGFAGLVLVIMVCTIWAYSQAYRKTQNSKPKSQK